MAQDGSSSLQSDILVSANADATIGLINSSIVSLNAVGPEMLEGYVAHRMELKARSILEGIQIDPFRVTAIAIERHVNQFGTCSLCSGFMMQTFMLECGDLFCGPCLENHFTKTLDARLKDLSARFDTEMILPQTRGEVLVLADEIAALTSSPCRTFEYSCPLSKCGADVLTAPIKARNYGDLIANTVHALQNTLSTSIQAMPVSSMSEGYFDLMFL